MYPQLPPDYTVRSPTEEDIPAILALFRQLSQEGRTIALVTHDPEIAAVTPRRIEIRDGKVARHLDAKLSGLERQPKAQLETTPQA